jgi:hypothetical protein
MATGKYTGLQDGINTIFGDPKWLAEKIKTVPADFVMNGMGGEFIRLQVLPGSWNSNNGFYSVAGYLMIEIYTTAGQGPARTNYIADKLDEYLVGKSIATSAGNAQFFISTIDTGGNDKANQTLYRTFYQIPFTFFGA